MINDYPQVVTIAGSDSDGSAGMQADLLTFFAKKVYGATVITACVAGNSFGIHAGVNMEPDFIAQEFKDLADDFKIRAAKTGMLADSKIINSVADNYEKYDFGPLVVDPVIITKHGDMLLEQEAYDALVKRLLPMADVLTPNFFEAVKLTGLDDQDPDFQAKAAHKLQELGAKNIMVKGRHDSDDQTEVTDYVLLEDGSTFTLTGPYFNTTHKNGTGDTLSAAITAELGLGKSVEEAIRSGKKYVDACIKNGIDVGHKFGPINHWA
ncbi:bifunctional hydroxymethylpyrimidine kinase/phosphomethylpyrimidine kinase [Fructilactobacillus sanfranciscensis]|uniref:bifunctional hydroxymethylpyrimidine kinase/phosphomethylpyrimidine kinase n=1 Tax=Fructilactobacillus sanfranciscensis TaxID=1625 RepID=UPI0006EFB52F|nr:bifunctional hydroxymethylpyrimidine kinase/phosphomethylpyrimidine kinase [Fructilactobacillus sanfranciscensis]KRM79106.1 phosphomethylpyrimidine kinase [Fructilactobacillus sanfranciscensis DSM 20451]MVF16271.1 bifunctional hydroxymethylpyrimidine kinase/phosphomethylpyrimidine kinase [Fructilactobacillus sanfranciscensis]POH12057.1 bifunctional hydroxymethylpyrimidine kinase/phosphomethylpyrimidine kinase [Fructilactobacillus sanfranciscensis]POH15953.1 bifunctional hydroxymethylpyrimidi